MNARSILAAVALVVPPTVAARLKKKFGKRWFGK